MDRRAAATNGAGVAIGAGISGAEDGRAIIIHDRARRIAFRVDRALVDGLAIRVSARLIAAVRVRRGCIARAVRAVMKRYSVIARMDGGGQTDRQRRDSELMEHTLTPAATALSLAASMDTPGLGWLAKILRWTGPAAIPSHLLYRRAWRRRKSILRNAAPEGIVPDVRMSSIMPVVIRIRSIIGRSRGALRQYLVEGRLRRDARTALPILV